MLIYLGYQIPYPPPGEQGILINFGDNPVGSGVVESQTSEKQRTATRPTAPVIKDDRDMMTQDYEDAPAYKPSRKPRNQQKEVKAEPIQKPATKEPAKPTEKPREVNKNALFPGKGTTGSQGDGEDDAPGNQGSLEGSPDSPNRQGGLGDVSGASLSGRSLDGRLPEPDYRVQESGKVIVRIKVDRNGNVIEAKAQQVGSTVLNTSLFAAAEKAALRAKFNANPNAPVYQNGTITYVFKLGQ
jgi:TonB family protein